MISSYSTHRKAKLSCFMNVCGAVLPSLVEPKLGPSP